MMQIPGADRVIQLQPDDADTWGSRGWALLNLGGYEEALESCDRAIQLQPDDAEAWDNRGIALYNLGRHDEALESLRKAVELADAQDLENISDFAALLAAETELSSSLRSLGEDNLGSARDALKGAIDRGKQAHKDDFQLVLFGYLRGAIRSGKIQFVQEAIGMIVSELGGDYGKLLRPFSIALEYMRTEDLGILERLQQEERELVMEIVEQAKGEDS
jgi:tetratricopeptide (TPR) repeat protein